MPTYLVTWTSIHEGEDAADAIERSKPRESVRRDGTFLDPGLPRAEEVVQWHGAWVRKSALDVRQTGVPI